MGEANFHPEGTPASSALPAPLTPEAVRQQLSVLLHHPAFADSERSRQLMEYLVERALRGDAGDLKEYALAADVFGRGSDFDPKLDSIVRAQVSRLRAKLLKYYQEDGRHDRVRFDLPRRGYALQLKAGSPATLVALVPPGEGPQAGYKRPRFWMPGTLAALLAVAIAIGVLRHAAPPAPLLSLTRLTPEDPPILNPSISRDGKLLSYSRAHENGAMDIYVQHMGGGPPRKILGSRFSWLQSLSPDGSRIVFAAFENGGGTYVVATLGGTPRRIAPLGHLPSISPDGKWVLYCRFLPDRRKIYVVSADGGEPRQLHPEFDLAQFAVWTPDGNYYFSGRSNAREEIEYWVASLDGSRLVSTGLRHRLMGLGLINADTQVWLMQWMKDHLYVETSDGDVQKLWRIRIDARTWRLSGDPELLASFLAHQAQPTIAESGRVVIADAQVRYSDWIVPLDSDTGKATGVASPVTGDIAAQPSEFLSGDGRHIVYATNSGGQHKFWLKDLTSGEESIIQTTPAAQRVRAISHDATGLYYESGEGAQTAAYRAALPDGAGQKLCDRCWLLAVSADEKTMLTSAPALSARLAFRHLDTGVVTELVSPGARSSYRFSPDGKWLAFHEMTDSFQSRVVILPVRDNPVPPNDWIVVAEGANMNYSPAWSPKGLILYFMSNRDGPHSVWAQRLDARTWRPLGQPLAVYHDNASGVPWDFSNLSVATDRMLLKRSKSTSGLWTAQLP